MTALLAAEAVSAGYPGRPVIEDVTLSLVRGELLAVLGPNGAGKSTLVKVLLGLVAPTRGSVLVEGKPLLRYGRSELARTLAWVPQSSAELDGFSTLEVALMGRAPHRGLWGSVTEEDQRRARALLEELGLGAAADRASAELSGGERRMLALARALLQDARVLLLDEPTAFLDLSHQLTALRRVRAFVAAGGAALAVLHDPNLAAAYADEVILLKDGRVLASGAPDVVLDAAPLSALYGVDLAMTVLQGQRIFAPLRDLPQRDLPKPPCSP